MQSLVYYLLIVWIFNTTICRCVWFADWSVSKKKTTLITRGDFLCDVFGVISIFVFSRKENKKNRKTVFGFKSFQDSGFHHTSILLLLKYPKSDVHQMEKLTESLCLGWMEC